MFGIPFIITDDDNHLINLVQSMNVRKEVRASLRVPSIEFYSRSILLDFPSKLVTLLRQQNPNTIVHMESANLFN